MYDESSIPSKHQPLTASSDDFGQYGSLFASDSDRQIPQPDDLYDQPQKYHTAQTPPRSNKARHTTSLSKN